MLPKARWLADAAIIALWPLLTVALLRFADRISRWWRR